MSIGERSVPCPLRAAARTAPDSPAIVEHHVETTFAELDRRVSGVARKLESLGLSDGARIGAYLPKNVGQFVLILAAIRAGMVFVPMSTRIPPEALPPLLETAGCSTLISDNEEALRAAESSGVRALRPRELLGGEASSGRASSGERACEKIRIPLERPATVVFTSGSSGFPKAALHTFGNHYFSALGSNANIRLASGDMWLHSLPLFHVGGLSILFRCLLVGAAMALPKSDEGIGASISRATHVSLVAAQLRRLLDEKCDEADLSGVKAILLGGSGIPERLLEEAHRRKLPVHTSYGLTEMSSQATTTRPGASLEELRTSGEPLPYREVSVADDGEILVKGETLFAGYVEKDRLSRPFDEAGWFHTKDLGRMDERGRLTIMGRKDNLFISGGENIQPEAVEEKLRRIPTVEDAVVVPVADEEFGFRPVAFVGGSFATESLSASLGASLPRFAVPVAFHPWPEDAPAGMKVDRGFFRERAEGLRRAR
ncbi:MAG: o-succinylbenzoate--CoA ligase [Actinomycetota bacterium]|jgi:O-succinylbenzoic acid--CoA ligase|nr:o-succinylbenzoate--CoA ligase [Actinomycetota bacterium]